MKRFFLFFLLAGLCWGIYGCDKSVDDNAYEVSEDKSIQEIIREVENMKVEQVREMAAKYKDAIISKKDELTELMEKYKQFPPSKLLSEEFNNLKSEVDGLNKSLMALKERLDIYLNKLSEMVNESDEPRSKKVMEI